MPRMKIVTGQTVVYPHPMGGAGWVTGSSRGGSFAIYVRPAAHGGGAFVDLGGGLVEAKTGEKTVWFNNRLWTLTEEQELIRKNREAETST